MMETYGPLDGGPPDLLMDLGILTPTTLAEQASPGGNGLRKSKEGSLMLKAQHEFSFKKGIGHGTDEVMSPGS